MRKALTALALLGYAGAASATVTVYTSKAAYDAAVAGISATSSTETFNSSSLAVVGPTGLNFSGFSVTDSGAALAGVDSGLGLYNADHTNYLGATLGNLFADGSLTFSLNAPAYAFGADFVNFGFDLSFFGLDPDNTSISLAGQTTTTDSAHNGSASFIGFVSTDAFSTVTIKTSRPDNDTFGIDNVTYASKTSAVPEIGTWTMMVAGFGLLGAAMRRSKTRVTFA